MHIFLSGMCTDILGSRGLSGKKGHFSIIYSFKKKKRKKLNNTTLTSLPIYFNSLTLTKLFHTQQISNQFTQRQLSYNQVYHKSRQQQRKLCRNVHALLAVLWCSFSILISFFLIWHCAAKQQNPDLTE